MPRIYLTLRRGALFRKRHSCPVCLAAERRLPTWKFARAYAHPNPLRSSVTIWRCRRHARLRFVPLDAKQGLGGGVYR
jgi:hypothetical protein